MKFIFSQDFGLSPLRIFPTSHRRDAQTISGYSYKISRQKSIKRTSLPSSKFFLPSSDTHSTKQSLQQHSSIFLLQNHFHLSKCNSLLPSLFFSPPPLAPLQLLAARVFTVLLPLPLPPRTLVPTPTTSPTTVAMVLRHTAAALRPMLWAQATGSAPTSAILATLSLFAATTTTRTTTSRYVLKQLSSQLRLRLLLSASYVVHILCNLIDQNI